VTRRGLLLIVLLALAAIAREQLRPVMAVGAVSLDLVPDRVGPWHSGRTTVLATDVLAQLRTDDYLNRRYVTSDGRWADVYVGYYRSQAQGASIHSPLNCLPGAGWVPVRADRVAFAGGTARRVLIQKGAQRLFVIYWYQSATRIEGNEYRSRLFTVLDTLRYQRNDAALVRVIVPVDDTSAGERGAVANATDVARLIEPHVLGQLFLNPWPSRSIPASAG
jgi:EpsI family protein